MKKYFVAISGLCLLAACLVFLNAFAQEGPSSADNGIILFMQGDVKVKSQKSDAWMNGQKGMVLTNGDNIKTGSKSWAELGFGKDFKNSVRIQENSHIILTDLGAIKINLIQGELRSLVEKLSKNAIFEIKTPVSVCGVRGTGWDTITDGKAAETDVYENSVFFSGLSGKGITIDFGKLGLLSDPSGTISVEDLPVDKINDWNSWKKDFTERRDAETGAAGSGGNNTAGQLGAAESHEELMEGMERGKDAVFQADEQKQVDKRLETERSKSTGGDPY
ncbi:MAG: FecR family protein [Candidatus Omnitrophota bacterium]|nr:FecR family protein [Candidatus Omnitrophota bacterium]